MSLSVETSVRDFFTQVNWDNRPLTWDPSVPMVLQRVQDFMAAMPWTGDPAVRMQESMQAALHPEWEAEMEDTLTLSELTALF
ncbi:MAG: hypothetical protein Q6K99_02925 [Thermostichales cyanobacterium BF4_bins_65]